MTQELNKVEDIKTVGIVGAGQMGAGIAQVMAQAGLSVLLSDVNAEGLKKAMASMDRSLSKLFEKGKLAEHPPGVLGRMKTSTSLADLAGCDLVVEAVNESEELKARIFRELDGLLPPHAILASNTSSLPITRLASTTRRPAKFIGCTS